MDSGETIRKKLTSPVLLLIHSMPVRDRIDNEQDLPVNEVSPGYFDIRLLSISHQNIENHLFHLLGR